MNLHASKADMDCAAEAIRLPGAIQPHGWMAVVNLEDAQVVAHSDNWPGAAAFDAAASQWRDDVAALVLHAAPQLLAAAMVAGVGWTCVAHRSAGVAILEFEPLPPGGEPRGEALATVARKFAPRLQGLRTVLELAELAASQMKALSGFGRCLVYRFDSDGHGEVLAQRADPGYADYLGCWFPASDIPAQARELYVVNQLRLIPDADAVPVPLRGVDAAWSAQGLDLSMADLRSVSPVHLQYMRNMQTLASMSVSIVVAGRLWGMISCHHRTPRTLSLDQREGCRHLGRLVSMQVEAQEGRVDAAGRLAARKLAFQVLSGLGGSDATLRQLLDAPEPLLDVVQATGVAVVHDDDCWSAGVVPGREHLLALARQISAARVQTFHVDRLANAYGQARLFADVAAGVLAVSISRVRRHVVLWFRPERVETLRWAGDPGEKARGPEGALSPRRSFDIWKQEVRGQCRRWSGADIACVADIRHALITLVLTRVQESELLSLDLARANRHIDAFAQSVSHELRQPLISAGAFGQLAKRQLEAAGDMRGVDHIDRVLNAVVQMSAIADTVLELARISQSTPAPSVVDISAIASDILAGLARRDPDRRVDVSVQGGMATQADASLMKRVLAHLLDNAWKFTAPRDRASITVGCDDGPGGETQWWVRDDGVGLDLTRADRIFQPFHRFHPSGDFAGIGAGLAIVHAAIARLGGSVRMEAAQGQGATVYFSLGPSRSRSAAPRARGGRGPAPEAAPGLAPRGRSPMPD